MADITVYADIKCFFNSEFSSIYFYCSTDHSAINKKKNIVNKSALIYHCIDYIDLSGIIASAHSCAAAAEEGDIGKK